MAGSVSGTVAVTLPGVDVSGDFAVTLDTTDPLTSSIAVSGTNITLDIGGFLLTERRGDLRAAHRGRGPDRRCRRRGDGGLRRPDRDAQLRRAPCRSAPAGWPASWRSPTRPSRWAAASAVERDVAAVRDQPVHPGGRPLRSAATRLEAGPYLRIVGEGIVLDLGDITLTASVSFQQATNSAGATRTVIAIAGGEVALGTDPPLLTGVDGLIVLTPAGMAMQLAGTLDLGSLLPDGVTIAGSFALAMNRRHRASPSRVTLGGRTVVPRPRCRAVRPRGRHRDHPGDRRAVA